MIEKASLLFSQNYEIIKFHKLKNNLITFRQNSLLPINNLRFNLKTCLSATDFVRLPSNDINSLVDTFQVLNANSNLADVKNSKGLRKIKNI